MVLSLTLPGSFVVDLILALSWATGQIIIYIYLRFSTSVFIYTGFYTGLLSVMDYIKTDSKTVDYGRYPPAHDTDSSGRVGKKVPMAGGGRLACPPPEDTLDHCMRAYNHGPYSRMSITFNSSKGLTNAPGQNNCFLNSAVQVSLTESQPSPPLALMLSPSPHHLPVPTLSLSLHL